MSELGAGIALDENLDFSIDTTGDLKGEEGVGELQKDLATQMIIALDRYIGQPPSGNLEAKVLSTASSIALADVRVDEVDKEGMSASFSSDREELTVNLTVFTEEGEQELVFEV